MDPLDLLSASVMLSSVSMMLLDMFLLEGISQKDLCNLQSNIQSERQNDFPGRETFYCHNSVPFTIDCIQKTVSALKGLAERLNFLEPGLHLQVYPHAVGHEYLVESATMKKGQQHLKTQIEYTQLKRRHSRFQDENVRNSLPPVYKSKVKR